jgi:hypothetical protein
MPTAHSASQVRFTASATEPEAEASVRSVLASAINPVRAGICPALDLLEALEEADDRSSAVVGPELCGEIITGGSSQSGESLGNGSRAGASSK